MYIIKLIFNSKIRLKTVFVFTLLSLLSFQIFSQRGNIKWSSEGNSYYRIQSDGIVQYTLPSNNPEVIISREQLTPSESEFPLNVSHFTFSKDEQKVCDW